MSKKTFELGAGTPYLGYDHVERYMKDHYTEKEVEYIFYQLNNLLGYGIRLEFDIYYDNDLPEIDLRRVEIDR